MTGRTSAFLLAAAACLAVPSALAVAQGTASLRVRVLDTGVPVTGCLVTVLTEVGGTEPVTARTDAQGEVRFPVLLGSETYRVEAACGDRVVRQAPLRLPPDAALEVVVALDSDPRESNAEPHRRREQGGVSVSRFPASLVADLPLRGRIYQNVIALAPGIQDVGGVGSLPVYGFQGAELTTEIDGIQVSSPIASQLVELVCSDAVETAVVTGAGAPPELGRGRGGFVRLPLNRGTSRFAGSAGLHYASADPRAELAPVESPDSLYSSISVSGPLLGERLWARLAWERHDEESVVELPGLAARQTVDRDLHAHQLTLQASPRNRLALQYRRSPLDVSGLGVDSSTPFESSQLVNVDSETTSLVWSATVSPRLSVRTTAALLTRDASIGPTSPAALNDCVVGLGLEGAYCRAFEENLVGGPAFRTVETRTDRFVVAADASWYAGEAFGMTHDLRFGLTLEDEDLDASATTGEIVDRFGTSFRVSLPLGSIGASSVDVFRGGIYVEDRMRPTDQVVISLGARVDREELGTAGYRPFDPRLESAAFIDGLAEDPAVLVAPRTFTSFDDFPTYIATLAEFLDVPASVVQNSLPSVARNSVFWLHERRRQDVDITHTRLSPTLSVSWDPFGDGRNILSAAVRRYHAELDPLDVSGVLFPDEVTLELSGTNGLELEAIGLPSGLFVDDDLDAPYVDERVIRFERELRPETTLGIAVTNRRFRDEVRATEINRWPGDFGRCSVATVTDPTPILPSPGTGTVTDPFTGEMYLDDDPGDGDGRTDDCTGLTELVPGPFDLVPLKRPDGLDDRYVQNPGWDSILLITNSGRRDYDAVTVDLTRRLYRGWGLRGSYVWSRFEGDGERYQPLLNPSPTLAADLHGDESTDRRHRVDIAATTTLPRGFRVGGVAVWQSGLPYSAFAYDVVRDPAPAAYGTLAAPAPRPRLTYVDETRNSRRNPSTWRLDIRVAKDLPLPGTRSLRLSAEVFNLLDETDLVVYNADLANGRTIDGIASRRRTPGRSWQVGMQLSY